SDSYSNSLTTFTSGYCTGAITNCANLCPFSTTSGLSLILSVMIPISLWYVWSIVPKATRNLVLSDVPERGLTCPSYPIGNSIAMSVLTIIVVLGGILTVSDIYKSNPESVGLALVGTVALTDSNLMFRLFMLFVLQHII